MKLAALAKELEEGLSELPAFDPHTHLVGDRLGARGLHDIALYHMVISDLYAAGCPTGARLTQYPGWASREEAKARIEEALPYFPKIQNTAIFWALRIILKDLYGWKEPITADNWQKLDRLIRERADDGKFHRSVLDRINIKRSCTELARRGDGSGDDRLQYVLEWAFFTRCQWGEYDTALYELERTWGRQPESPAPIGGGLRAKTERTIHTISDVHEAIAHYVNVIPLDKLVSTAVTYSSDIDYTPVSEKQMAEALARREQAGIAERNIYATYINEAFLTELERIADRFVYQFSTGAEPLPFETGSRMPQKAIEQLGQIVARHPKLRFQCFLASRHANQSLCTLCRELPNLSLVGYWWHNFFPDAIRQVMNERLDMLPVNRQIGFFSDAYCVEWTYGKMMIVRKQMARVLAGKVEQGQYKVKDALAIAGQMLYDTPRDLLGLKPYECKPAKKRK